MNVTSADQSDARWQKTPVAHLMRHRPSGNYYARIRVSGKLIWKSSFEKALKPTASAWPSCALAICIRRADHGPVKVLVDAE